MLDEQRQYCHELSRLPAESHGYYLSQLFQTLEPHKIISLLAACCDATVIKADNAELLLAAFLTPTDLQSLMSYETLMATYTAAEEHKEGGYLQRLLLRGNLRNILLPEQNDVTRPQLSLQLEELTLGQRRALAKGHDPKLLAMLVYDQDAMVIQHLLNNSRVRELQVLKIASLRPQLAAVLVAIYQHNKWAKYYSVRKALALNPSTPGYLVASLVNYLRPADIRLFQDEVMDIPTDMVRRLEKIQKLLE